MANPDKLLLEILIQRFRSIAEEMGYALQRTGHTVFVNETADLGVALVTPEGEIFGYPESIGITTFANLDFSEMLSRFPSYEDGDIVVTNDAYTSGAIASHLPDINMLKPVFYDGILVCFVFAYVHSTDVGGRVPGSISPTNHEIFQEGIRIPPTKMYRAGKPSDDLINLVLANCRTPADNRGDLRAMIAALKVGERRIHEVITRYGHHRFLAAMHDVLDYAENRARRLIERIPDGIWRFADYLDNDVATELPVKLCAQVTVRGSELHIDFAGSDIQLHSAFNIFTKGRPHPWLVFKLMFLLLTFERDIPLNAGLLRPVKVSVPEDSVLNCRFPAAIGMRTTTGLRVQDAIFGALATAMPDQIPAAGAGSISPMVFAQYDGEGGAMKVAVLEPLVGGTGAHSAGDGVHARDVVDLANLRNNPIEIVEATAGVRIHAYGLAEDSGGPGRYRGGCGSLLEFEVLSAKASLTPRGLERHRFSPWGLNGGYCGRNGAISVKRNGSGVFVLLGKVDTISLGIGDVVRIIFAGGGGYGDPYLRDPARVLDDVLNGYVSAELAARDYGVVISGKTFDPEKTATLRGVARTASPGFFDLGAERDRYDNRWSDDVWAAFVSIVYGQPFTQRHETRTRLWRAFEARANTDLPLGVDGLHEEWAHIRGQGGRRDVGSAAAIYA